MTVDDVRRRLAPLGGNLEVVIQLDGHATPLHPFNIGMILVGADVRVPAREVVVFEPTHVQ